MTDMYILIKLNKRKERHFVSRAQKYVQNPEV